MSLFRLALCVIALSPGVFAAPARAQDYDGPDAGYLVYSVGSIHIAMNFTFEYRSLAPVVGSRVWNGLIECRCVGVFRPWMRDPDFTEGGVGKVVVRRLPLGDYEIHDFGFGGSLAGLSTSYSSGREFAIPFSIRPG